MKTTSKAILNAAFALLCGITVLACSDGKSNNKGTGGMAGTAAGTGGSGGSAGGGSNTRCAPGATVAVGDKPLVDDFEDGDLMIIHPENGTEDGRAGEAALYNGKDTTAMMVSSGTALHFTANPNMQWPSFGLPIANCYDASAYAGVSFMIKGTAKDSAGKDIANPIKFGVATPPSTPEPAGTCPCPDTDVCAQCYNSFGFFLPSLDAANFQKVTILWGQLKQGAWGNIAPPGYDPAKEIMELDWGVGVNVGTFDIYLDDVSFIQK